MNYFRKTKIIATFGPTIRDEKIFQRIIDSGVNVIRFNFSHLTPEDAKEQIHWVRNQLKKSSHDVAFLGDLKGPEIRTDMETYNLEKGQQIYFCYSRDKQNLLRRHVLNRSTPLVGIDHPQLHTLVKPGQKILADDGSLEFHVIKVENKMLRLRVEQGGLLKTKKSVIIPGVDAGLPILNSKDKENLKLIVKEKFAWIAASFVSSAKDVKTLRSFIKKCGGDIPIISKIESRSGVENINEIIEASDGVMVARGDLGLEFPFEEVPVLQETIINKAKAKGVVTIIATQMLNSMIENPRPSRPEVSDISYAIRSRVDAVMLSGETASGKYPEQAVKSMVKIITSSEIYFKNEEPNPYPYKGEYRLIPFCEMAIKLAFAVGAKCLIAISSSGKSPRYLSSFRANLVNMVATSNRDVYYRSFLYYSIFPVMIDENIEDKSERLLNIISKGKNTKFFKKGDKVIHIFTHETRRISKKFELPTNSIREEIMV